MKKGDKASHPCLVVHDSKATRWQATTADLLCCWRASWSLAADRQTNDRETEMTPAVFHSVPFVLLSITVTATAPSSPPWVSIRYSDFIQPHPLHHFQPQADWCTFVIKSICTIVYPSDWTRVIVERLTEIGPARDADPEAQSMQQGLVV